MADISQIKLPDNTTYDINAKKVNSHTVATDVPSGAVFTDTKNTAGSTDTSSKIYLVGATEQSANPQTYSDDQVYVENGKTYAREFDVKNPNGTIVVALVSDSNNSGQFNLWNSSGVATVFGLASSGQLNCYTQNVIERVDNSNKRRVRHESNTTDHYGRTIWYEGSNNPRVIIQGNDEALKIYDTAGAERASFFVDGYDHGGFNLRNEDDEARIVAYGSGEIYANTYIARNSSETITAQMEGSSGKVSCLSMNNQDISDEFTISKTSGNWTVKEITAVRSGNTVQLTIAFKGNGAAVSAGSNAFVGTVTAGEFPVGLVRLLGYGGSSIVMGYIQPTGAIEIKVLVAAYTLASTGTFSVMCTYICSE